MFKFLWFKNIQTDSEFKIYQVLKLILFTIFVVVVLIYATLNITSQYGSTARTFSILGFALPLLLWRLPVIY
ncbi:hypothetical protein RyT2_03650 [Pseudolactococcus yaeyamensis]